MALTLITPPADGSADFICLKQSYIVLQAIVDVNLKLRGTYANTPGSAHNVAMWRRSPLFETYNRSMTTLYVCTLQVIDMVIGS